MRYESILDAIGHTPMVRINHLARQLPCNIYAKLEFMNPGGSVKDRIGKYMLAAAEQRGELAAGGTVIECTSGNTGMGLALAAAERGYKTVFTIADKQSREKVDMLKAMGAEVIVCPTDVPPDDPRMYIQVARRLARETAGAFLCDQYDNPDNTLAHYASTGPEIWQDSGGRITHFVCCMGTCGTISGAGRYLKERNPHVKVIGVDPEGSIFYDLFRYGRQVTPHVYKLEGIGEDFIPQALDWNVIDDVIQVGDKDSFLMTRKLARAEGIFAGGSSGAAMLAALQVAQALGPDDLMVVMLPDGGRQYLGKIYNDEWMRKNGYLEAHGSTANPPRATADPAAVAPQSDGRHAIMGFATRAIHAGQPPDPATGAIMTPVYLTSTYVQEAPGRHHGYEYSRTGNPTRTALEASLAALEEGAYGLAFASGLAAESTLLQSLDSGDHVVCCQDLYGGTYRLLTRVFARFGIAATFVDATDPGAVGSALRPETRLVWLESPSNPLLTVCDIAAIAELAHAHGVKVAVDNTFASPYLQQPLRLGADIVIHSTTKYLGGHSDVVGGALVTNDAALHQELKFLQNAVGAVPGPLDCFLVLRGIKTLPVRMRQHCTSALQLARHLETHPEVQRVYYPGLESSPFFALAGRQMRAFGGMLSLELKGGAERNLRFTGKTRLFALAESLGGVESLVGFPMAMTHAAIPEEQRRKAGLPDALVRLSVGLEDVEDLIEDIEQAIAASGMPD